MAYSELIKNLDTLRTYIRSFYIYGFKTRNEFFSKSARTYDDEKRRLENYLSGYMAFRVDESGKVSFLSIDSRKTAHNPLYKIFKAKSFTDMDIFLHFVLMDILADGEQKSLSQILDEISAEYLDGFSSDLLPEESTLRKKLKEYAMLGLIKNQKCAKTMFYSREPMTSLEGAESAIAFFSEVAPCGVVGSFLLDRFKVPNIFQFKHHYITSSIESDFVETAFSAIRSHRVLLIEQKRHEKARVVQSHIVPMMIYSSVQGGRMYLMAYRVRGKYFQALRFDYIVSMKEEGVFEDFEQKRAEFERFRKNIFGVSLKQTKQHDNSHIEHISFRVRFCDDEGFIYQRLLREKRCGDVLRLDRNTAEFSADVFDVQEVIPWARTFISRITHFDCSDKGVVRRFWADIRKMQKLYED